MTDVAEQADVIAAADCEVDDSVPAAVECAAERYGDPICSVIRADWRKVADGAQVDVVRELERPARSVVARVGVGCQSLKFVGSGDFECVD